MTGSPGLGALYEEHVLLGADFEEGAAGTPRVACYAGESTDGSGAFLADLTGCAYLLAGGTDAEGFCAAALAGRRCDVGELAWEAVLNGAGRLVSVPLLMRTGTTEHVIIDASRRSEALGAWLDFLSRAASEEGGAAFPDLALEDASGMLVPMLLAGPSATEVLSDYLSDDARPPVAGEVLQLRLDAIPTLVARLPGAFVPPAYLVLAPVASSRILWRSLLSFAEVAPIGHRRLRELLDRHLPWAGALGDASSPARRSALANWGLVRGDDAFVGSRALA